MHLPLHRLVAAPDVLHHLHPKCAAQGSELNLLPARPSLEVISLTFVSPLLADIWLLAADSEAAVSAENTLLCESYTVSTGKLLKGHGWMLAVSVLLEHHAAKQTGKCQQMLHRI